MQVHSANSLDDRFDSSCNGGSMDTTSNPTRTRDQYSERLATKATCDVQEKCREPKHGEITGALNGDDGDGVDGPRLTTL